MKTFIGSLKERTLTLSQKVGAAFTAPTKGQAQLMLFGTGVVLLGAGLSDPALAQGAGGGLVTEYNDTRLSDSLNAILTYIEGTFGAMVMVSAGLGAILSSAFGQ